MEDIEAIEEAMFNATEAIEDKLIYEGSKHPADFQLTRMICEGIE